ncbi:hypothetical protein BDP55DRAFT_626162 [Colletotrichum godetiae]|uniref:Uncharacterized protein n=1 Tax=Colletotrichum godetiae TaxID=1209918 RepID=A0AAJ0EYW7_9PEZI|nr:uncharacterized protein BDP55DRAFT_626162 [Colletotrichum godetiae]KAK1700602.1 hypothetical protein BDP55DRAFT_626162 [Colletotrichum godetiae]
MSLVEANPLNVAETAVPHPTAVAHTMAGSTSGDATPRASSHNEPQTDNTKKDVKNKVRGLFGLGKKKEESNVSNKSSSSATPAPAVTSNPSLTRDTSRASARSTTSPYVHPSSPSRGMSTSPRVPSPAGSQIFERDVDNMSIKPQSPAIPSHIQTENHIPPVLDASSEAITDDHLDPDSVEIVTHSQHQPAAAAVTGANGNGTPHPPDSMAASWTDELRAFADREDASNFNALDNADVRRLSFISFADVVQAEQGGHSGAAGSRDSIHVAGLTSLSSINARSPSPIRSPVSSQGPGTSPPTSNPASVKGLEMSPGRKSLGSPISSHHNLNMSGELNIETMSQALRRTGSTDLSGIRSLPTSPIEGPSR